MVFYLEATAIFLISLSLLSCKAMRSDLSSEEFDKVNSSLEWQDKAFEGLECAINQDDPRAMKYHEARKSMIDAAKRIDGVLDEVLEKQNIFEEMTYAKNSSQGDIDTSRIEQMFKESVGNLKEVSKGFDVSVNNFLAQKEGMVAYADNCLHDDEQQKWNKIKEALGKLSKFQRTIYNCSISGGIYKTRAESGFSSYFNADKSVKNLVNGTRFCDHKMKMTVVQNTQIDGLDDQGRATYDRIMNDCQGKGLGSYSSLSVNNVRDGRELLELAYCSHGFVLTAKGNDSYSIKPDPAVSFFRPIKTNSKQITYTDASRIKRDFKDLNEQPYCRCQPEKTIDAESLIPKRFDEKSLAAIQGNFVRSIKDVESNLSDYLTFIEEKTRNVDEQLLELENKAAKRSLALGREVQALRAQVKSLQEEVKKKPKVIYERSSSSSSSSSSKSSSPQRSGWIARPGEES